MLARVRAHASTSLSSSTPGQRRTHRMHHGITQHRHRPCRRRHHLRRRQRHCRRVRSRPPLATARSRRTGTAFGRPASPRASMGGLVLLKACTTARSWFLIRSASWLQPGVHSLMATFGWCLARREQPSRRCHRTARWSGAQENRCSSTLDFTAAALLWKSVQLM